MRLCASTRKAQDAERAEAGDRWEETGFVFTTERGRPMSPYTLVKYWHDVCNAAGLGTLRFHDLRHTAVSLLLALGVPSHVVREVAGHSDIRVTMTVYAHGNLSEKAAALAQLEREGYRRVVVTGCRQTGRRGGR